MKKILMITLLIAVALFAASAVFFWFMARGDLWLLKIAEYEKADRVHPPKLGVIVFTGSSSIRLWSTLEADMAPLDVINRGFGGATVANVNRFAPRSSFLIIRVPLCSMPAITTSTSSENRRNLCLKISNAS